MGKQTEKLITLLNDCIGLINKHDENCSWSKWMTIAKKRLINSDYSGITKVLDAYGGMGSFNDYVFYDNKTNNLFKEDNETLNYLRNEIYEIANKIKRDYETEGQA